MRKTVGKAKMKGALETKAATSAFLSLAMFAMAVATVVMLPSVAHAGVFDDAIVWCRGALDKNGDGYPAQGDFPDALHVGDNSYYGHNGYSYYKSSEPTRRLQISTEDVVDPATCKQLGLHQCLKFTQPLYDNDGATWIDEQAFLLTPALNSAKPHDADGWTFYIRFRPDGGARLANDTDTQLLFNYFNSWAANGGGAMLWLRGSPTNGYFSVQLGNNDRSLTGMQDRNQYYCLCTNKWTDVIVSKKDDTVDVYSMREGGRLYHTTYTYSRSESAGFYSNCVLGRYLYNASAHAYTASSTYNFRGSVRDLAVWPRALSYAEAMEIIRPTGTEKFRIGTHNGSSLEFAGVGSPTVDPDSSNGWRSALATIGAGQSQSVRFNMKKEETGLDERLFLVATPESALGTLALTLNGSNIGEVAVQPDKTVGLHVEKGLLVEGENTLALANVSSGTIGIDSLSFGGSWQLLEDDDKSSGGAGQNGDKDFYLNDTNLVANLKSIIHAGPKVSNTNLTFHFTMPSDIVATIRRVCFSMRGKNTTDTKWIAEQPDIVFNVFVNGVQLGSLVFPKSGMMETSSLTVPVENLVAGENKIRVENATPLWYDPAQESDPKGRYCWLPVDFYRLEVMKDPGGFVFVVK